jgi:hypothetical protein
MIPILLLPNWIPHQVLVNPICVKYFLLIPTLLYFTEEWLFLKGNSYLQIL